MTHAPERSLLAAALVAAALSMTACGGSDDDPAAPAPAGPTGPAASGSPMEAAPGAAASDGGPDTGPSDASGADAAPPALASDPASDPVADAPAPVETASGLPEDVARRLERATSLFRGEPIELAAALVERFDDPGSGVVETNRAPAEPAFANATGTAVGYACDGAGTAARTDTVDAAGMLRESDIAFSGCRIGAFTVDGTARRGANPVPARIGAVPAPFARPELEPFYPRLELRIVDARDGAEVVLGRDAQAYTNFSERTSEAGLLNRNWATGGPATLVDADGRRTRATIAVGIGYADDGSGGFGTVGLSGRVDLSGDGADGLIDVTLTEPFERGATDARFATGNLIVRGEGFEYVLDAANGDPATFQLTVDADGTTSAFTVPWSERFEVDAFRPATVDLGFGG